MNMFHMAPGQEQIGTEGISRESFGRLPAENYKTIAATPIPIPNTYTK
jgi:hypothetical protein